MKKLLAAATLLVLSGQAPAHDLWLEREGFGLYYGHKHYGHEGLKLMEYEPEWLREALCFDTTERSTSGCATEASR
jgi:uncharacterized GH25 family protein